MGEKVTISSSLLNMLFHKTLRPKVKYKFITRTRLLSLEGQAHVQIITAGKKEAWEILSKWASQKFPDNSYICLSFHVEMPFCVPTLPRLGIDSCTVVHVWPNGEKNICKTKEFKGQQMFWRISLSLSLSLSPARLANCYTFSLPLHPLIQKRLPGEFYNSDMKMSEPGCIDTVLCLSVYRAHKCT